MYPVSARFLAAPKSSHVAIVRADVYHAQQFVRSLDVIGDDVSADETATIRRVATLTFSDPDDDLVPTTARRVNEVLDPYRAEIKVSRGFRYTDGTEELAPLGWFRMRNLRITEHADGGVALSTDGFDRSLVCQDRLPTAWPIPAGAAVEQEIARLLVGVFPGMTFALIDSGHVTPSLLLPEGANPWTEASKLAESIGARLSMNRDNVCVLQPETTTAANDYLWSFTEGVDADFWQPDRTVTVDDVANYVVVVGTNSQGATVRGVAYDDDPESPTWVQGPFGQRVHTEQSERVVSSQQATDMAKAVLVKRLIASEDVTFEATVNPALDEGDTVAVTRARLGLHERRMIVKSIRWPLVPGEPMRVTARRSVLVGAENPY